MSCHRVDCLGRLLVSLLVAAGVIFWLFPRFQPASQHHGEDLSNVLTDASSPSVNKGNSPDIESARDAPTPEKPDGYGAADLRSFPAPVLWPRPIAEGSTVAVVAPGSAVDHGQLDKGICALEELGLIVKPGQYLRRSFGERAGTVRQRLGDLNWAIRDASVDAIWCARGGDGSEQLLSGIDWGAFDRNSPKVLIGYSDITVLQMALFHKARVVSISGPMVAEDYGFGSPAGVADFTRERVLYWLNPRTWPKKISNPPGVPLQTVCAGRGSGILLGGNLSRICDLLDSEYLPDLSSAVLLLEDVHENAASVRAMFRRLQSGGGLCQINGLVLGDFDTCSDECLHEIAREALDDREIPIVSGLAYGHIDTPRVTLPLGAWVEVDARLPQPEITVYRQPLDCLGRSASSQEHPTNDRQPVR